MGDPFRNPHASLNARVEALERENQRLRAKISALQSRPEAQSLRRGRATWLMVGLLASFGPLAAAPLLLSPPSHALGWAHRDAPPLFGPRRAEALRSADGGERVGSYPGVALHAGGEREAARRAGREVAWRAGDEREAARRTGDGREAARRAGREAGPQLVPLIDSRRPVVSGPRLQAEAACRPGDPLCAAPAAVEVINPWAEAKDRDAPCRKGDSLCADR
ncbi:MAG TPA: hypothetical protein VFS00_01620 [Polyangiaceae bacterium]|nr:hypothetical protein [Polyangiaceae bacterium]